MLESLFLSNFIIIFYVFGFGVIIGSFLNVCIVRLPKCESIVTQPSHCMKCDNRIKPYDLIPIFSWIFLRGKCRFCNTKISVRYPLIELLNGLMWIISFVNFGISISGLINALLFSALIVVSFMDWDTQEINTGVILFIGILAIPLIIFTHDISLINRLIGAFIISVPFLIIGYLTKGIGFGDILLMASAGLLLGFHKIVVATFIGIVLASIVGIILKTITKNSRFAFGPWLSIGIAISALYGTEILNWYLSLIK